MLHHLNKFYARIVFVGCLALFGESAIGQSIVVTNQTLEVTYNKTSNIIFPTAITSVDRGSQDILAQKAKKVENVLQVKAGRRNMPETNLTIITADGTIHHFTIKYSDSPRSQTLLSEFSNKNSSLDKRFRLLFSDGVDRVELSRMSKDILNTKKAGKICGDRKFGMKLSLKEIFINEHVVFYRIQIKNQSNVDYDIKSLRFYIRDKTKARRTAAQEIEVLPIFIEGEKDKVKGGSKIDAVYALQKFTIPDAKVLEIDLFEDHGGRDLKLKVSNNKIVKANVIPTK